VDRKQSEIEILGNFKRVLYPLVVFGLVTILFYGYVFLQYHISQSLLAAGIILVSTALAPWIYHLAQRGKIELAGVILTIGMAVAYGINEFAWSGLTLYHLFGGLLLILLSGSFVLPQRRLYWLLMAVIYGAAILGLNWLDPITRFEQSGIPILLPYAVGSVSLLILVLVFQLVIQLPLNSIRTRLVLTFILLVLIPVSLTGVILSYLNAQSAQQQGFDQLNLILSIKTVELQNWMDNLKSTLN
jgi:hypothetical protein